MPSPSPAQVASAVVLRLQTPEQYREARCALYESAESLRWVIRRHKAGLVAAGALVAPVGRWLIDPEKFDAYVLGLVPSGRVRLADDDAAI